MSRLPAIARRLAHGEEAATLVEYALVISIIALACIASITTLTTALMRPFQTVTTALGS